MKRIIGCKILEIKKNTNSAILEIITDKGTMLFDHEQECCEEVWLESGFEDLERLVGKTIQFAEEVSNEELPVNPLDEGDESYTWTFYKIATSSDYCTLRFYGYSNGYYSEGIDIEFIEDNKNELYN